MERLECELCLPDIRSYYDTCAQITELNYKMMALAVTSPQGAKSLDQGRVIILRDDVSSCVLQCYPYMRMYVIYDIPELNYGWYSISAMSLQ